MTCGPGEDTRDPAQREFEAAVRLRPDHVDALANLGQLLLGRGQLTEATAVFRRALGYSPGIAELHFLLANSLYLAGKGQEALVELQAAVRLKPGFAAAQDALREITAARR